MNTASFRSAGQDEGFAKKRLPEGTEHINRIFAGGQDIPPDLGKLLRADQGSEPARDLLLDFYHPHVSIHRVIVKWHAEVVPESLHRRLEILQPTEPVEWRRLAGTPIFLRLRFPVGIPDWKAMGFIPCTPHFLNVRMLGPLKAICRNNYTGVCPLVIADETSALPVSAILGSAGVSPASTRWYSLCRKSPKGLARVPRLSAVRLLTRFSQTDGPLGFAVAIARGQLAAVAALLYPVAPARPGALPPVFPTARPSPLPADPRP